MISNDTKRSILRVLNQTSKPVPLGTIALRVGKPQEIVSEVILDLCLEGAVRRASATEVDQGVLAYTVTAWKPSLAYETTAAIPESAPTVKMPRVVGIDFDGVMGDFVTAVAIVIKEQTGKVIDPGTNKEWDLFGFLTPEEKTEVFSVINRPGWCASIPLYPGTVEGINRLVQAGHTLLCVTAPWDSDTWESERRRVIKKHFGDAFSGVIATHAKEFVSCDVLIEDRVSNLEKWVDRTGGIGLLWKQPYNRTYNQQKMRTVSSWEDVLNLILGKEDP